MVDALIMLSFIAIGVSIILLLDWMARRKDRRSKNRPAA